MKLSDDHLVSSSESISEKVPSLSANLAYLYTMAHLSSGQNPAGIVRIVNIIASDNQCFISITMFIVVQMKHWYFSKILRNDSHNKEPHTEMCDLTSSVKTSRFFIWASEQ